MKINIGCGKDYREGWLNTDISHSAKADVVFDIGKNKIIVPGSVVDVFVADEVAEEIYISGVLEQIGPNSEFLHAMNECWRVLKKGGLMKVVVPNARYSIAHQDPMDIRKFTKETFNYFLKGSRHFDLYGSVYGFKPWNRIVVEENERHILVVDMWK